MSEENKVEYVKVQISKQNIEYIKANGSFAKIINKLLDRARKEA